MICKKCTIQKISHKRKMLCTSCYTFLRKEQWSISALKRRNDPLYVESFLKKKRARHRVKSYTHKICKSCPLPCIKGSKMAMCPTCSSKDRLQKKITYQKLRKKTHLPTRIRENLKSSINRSFKAKNNSIINLLGCSVFALKSHLEAKFQPGMAWDNYGLKGWHIDHIKPLSSFDLSDSEQFKEACHYTNLQPLWAKDNLSKGAKYVL